MEQPVEDVRGFAGGGGDDLGVERRVAVRDVGVEQDAGVGAVARVDLGPGLAVAAGAEELAVRGRGVARPPDARDGMGVVGVDDRRQGGGVGLVTNVPLSGPHEPRVGQALDDSAMRARPRLVPSARMAPSRAGLSTAGSAGLQVREAVREARPGVDLAEQLGDPHPRQHGVEAALQRLGCLGRGAADRRDNEPAVGDPRLGQLARRGQGGDPLEARMEGVGAAGKMVWPAWRTARPRLPSARSVSKAGLGSRKSPNSR